MMCPPKCLDKASQPITDAHFTRLSELEKWSYYGRLPWKLILDILLLIVSTTQIIVMNHYSAPYSRANNANWEYLLAPSGSANGGNGGANAFGYAEAHYLYTLPELLASMNKVVEVYYTIDQVSVDRYEYVPTDSTAGTPPVTMEMSYYRAGDAIFNLNIPFDPRLKHETFNLSSVNDLGPLTLNSTNGNTILSLVRSSHKISLAFELTNTQFDSARRTCFLWHVMAVYDFSVRGRIKFLLDTSTRLCPANSSSAIPSIPDSVAVQPLSLWKWSRIFGREKPGIGWSSFRTEICLLISLIILAGVNEILYCQSILRGIEIYYAQAGQKALEGTEDTTRIPPDSLNEVYDPDKDLTNSEIESRVHQIMNRADEGEVPPKSGISRGSSVDTLTRNDRLFNVWLLIASLGNLCNIVGPFYALYDEFFLRSHSDAKLVFTGLGCMLAWISVVQYLEGSSSYYVIITTLRRGTPRVARFLVGVLPVFIGYAMFGVAFFSTASEKFSTVDDSCATLFSLLNGDSIHDIFDQLYPAHPVVSRIYLYSFISLFIYAVLNIFVAIIEDAFFASKAFQLESEQRSGRSRRRFGHKHSQH